MHQVIKDNNVVILWDSVNEPLAHSQKLKDESNKGQAYGYATGSSYENRGDQQDWLGAPSVKVLKDRLTTGWAEGAEKLQKIATRDINPTSIRRRRTRSDQGDEVDMQAVWRGDMSRAWTRTRRQSRAGTSRTINLMVTLSDSCGVDSSKLFWRGASVLKLADALTTAGYSVGIYGAVLSRDCSSSGKTDIGQFVEIKATDSPLDLSALAALTAMPGWFRTAGFAGIVAGCDALGRTPTGGLGRPDNGRVAEFAEMVGITDMVFQPSINNQASAEAWIDEVLNKVEQPELKVA